MTPRSFSPLLFLLVLPCLRGAVVAWGQEDRVAVLPPVAANTSPEYAGLAQVLASAALEEARKAPEVDRVSLPQKPLPLDGKPGDVRLVSVVTHLPSDNRWLVPSVPLPPFTKWNRWFDLHERSSHASIDWMDEKGHWWHTELRGHHRFADEFRVGEGIFPAAGMYVYGIFIVPGRTDPEYDQVVLDEKVECDYRVIEREARKYGRHDRRSGDPGTADGKGAYNVGLGGPAFKPAQNSNTYVSYLLRQAGIKHAAPPDAVGWETVPHFPYSVLGNREEP